MKSGCGVKKFLFIMLAILAISGCSVFMVEDEVYRGVSVEDVVAMSKAGVGSGVIKRKIEVSRSQFSLDTNDIIRLKSEGVSDDVINAMIDTDEDAEQVDLERSYDLYDYWFNYYNTYYPVSLYFNRYYPLMNYSYGPFHPAMYRWSGDMGAYYRDFPVGLPVKGYGKYPFEIRMPEEKEEKKE